MCGAFPARYREPDLRIFDGQEIALVERVIRFYRLHWRDGSESPDLLTLPWEAAAPRGRILPIPWPFWGWRRDPFRGDRSPISFLSRRSRRAGCASSRIIP